MLSHLSFKFMAPSLPRSELSELLTLRNIWRHQCCRWPRPGNLWRHIPRQDEGLRCDGRERNIWRWGPPTTWNMVRPPYEVGPHSRALLVGGGLPNGRNPSVWREPRSRNIWRCGPGNMRFQRWNHENDSRKGNPYLIIFKLKRVGNLALNWWNEWKQMLNRKMSS